MGRARRFHRLVQVGSGVCEELQLRQRIGLPSFTSKAPFTPPALTYFRKRLSVEDIMQINNDYLETKSPTPEHAEDKKSRRRSSKQIRATIRKMLGYLRRDLRYLEEYMSDGYALDPKFVDNYLVILELYRQQNKCCNGIRTGIYGTRTDKKER